MNEINYKKCILIGSPVKQSLSPVMHNAAYKALGIDKEYIFESYEIKTENLEGEIAKIRSEFVHGVSVTIPHKVDIISFLDRVDQTAKKIGAVNTIFKKEGRLIGTNTDWIGIATPIKQKTEIAGKKVALLGAGGAARAACFALTEAGANVTIINRTLQNAEKLANDFNCNVLNQPDIMNLDNFEIILNSVPYQSNAYYLPIKPEYFNSEHIFFDMVYTPHQTTLIQAALKSNAKVIYGIEMLLHQGAEQFKIYTGLDAPVEVMKEALLKAIQ